MHYTLSTSKFVIINSTWDGNFQTFKCHLIPRVHYSAAGDLTYKQVIDAFCLAFGKTAVYKDAGAAWLAWQFLPTGKMIILNNAQTLFQQLKQKYFIFACDNGNDEILFYTAFTHAASPDYTITGCRFAVDFNVDQRRQYIWRDENETLHKTVPSFAVTTQPDGSATGMYALADLGSGTVLAGSWGAVGRIFRSTDYGSSWDAGYSVIRAGVQSFVNLGGGIVLASGGYNGWIWRSTDYGITWSEIQTLGNDYAGCLTDCGNGILLCGFSSGGASKIYRSVDYGLTWVPAGTLAAENNCWAIYYLGSGVCLAGTGPGGKLFRSTDYAATWNFLRQLCTEAHVYSLLSLGAGVVLTGTGSNGHVWKSTDAGATWNLFSTIPIAGVLTLNTLGGVLLAGTTAASIYRSIDFGATWSLVTAFAGESEVRSFITLGNGVTLAGTTNHGKIYKSLNCSADLDVIHNLGFLPSAAVEPSAYFLLSPPTFDPFQVHLKYQSSDYIRVNIPTIVPGPTVQTSYDFLCAQVSEVLDLKAKSMPYRMVITQTEWLSNTAAGPLPGTIERVGSYTPLVTAQFNAVLSENDNNVQAAMDTLDNHTHGAQYYAATGKDVLVDADQFISVDSETLSHVLKQTPWSNIKACIGMSDIIGANAEAAVIAAGVTTYLAPFCNTFSTSAYSALPWPKAGTLRNLYIRTGTAQPASGSLVITLQVAGSDRALTIAIPAGGTAGVYSNLVNTADLLAGNNIRWKFVNNASANSAAIYAITMELNP